MGASTDFTDSRSYLVTVSTEIMVAFGTAVPGGTPKKLCIAATLSRRACCLCLV